MNTAKIAALRGQSDPDLFGQLADLLKETRTLQQSMQKRLDTHQKTQQMLADGYDKVLERVIQLEAVAKAAGVLPEAPTRPHTRGNGSDEGETSEIKEKAARSAESEAENVDAQD
jgi:hypothetical protein